MISKKTKKLQEELPGFLLNLNRIPSDLNLPTKESPSEHYLGPLFFGGCVQHHPPHVIPREYIPPPILTSESEHDFLQNIFVDTYRDQKDARKEVFQKWHLAKKRKIFEPPVAQHIGVRRVFVPEVRIQRRSHETYSIDLGETESEITGEMCREIPVCRFRSSSSISEQYEMVNLSDITEKTRPFMPYNERIAHSHFLKEFVTVKIIGPKIPASITIKKLPTKRKRLSDFNFQLESNEDKQEKVSKKDVKEKTVEEVANKKEEDDNSIKEIMKPIAGGLEDTLDDDEMETPSEIMKKEESHGESIIKQEDDGPFDDEGEDRKSNHSDKQELEAEGQVETENEEKGKATENENPTEGEIVEGEGSAEEE